MFAIWSGALAQEFHVDPGIPCTGSLECFKVGDVVALSWRQRSSHPLVARAFRTAQSVEGRELLAFPTTNVSLSKFIDYTQGDAVHERSRVMPVLIIGEIHDNSDHHDFRSKLISSFVNNRNNKPAVIFEQIRDDQQAALDQFAELNKDPAHPRSVAFLKRLLNWDKSGWSRDGYDPLFQAALDAKLPIYAGDVPRADIMKVAKDGEGALPAEERKRLGLDTPLGSKLDDASLAEIEEAHCGAMPKEFFGGMAYAQRYRDAHLADAVLKAAETHGSAILIAGNGHVRTDRGVPWYIHQRAPDKKVVSVMLIEVEDGKNDPESYVPRDPDGKPATDYIIFTPAADHGDPCEKMKAKKAG